MPDPLGKKAQDLDWAMFRGSMPLEGVVRPTGSAKANLVTRMNEAFRISKARETA